MSDVATEPTPTEAAEADPRDARIAELEAENAELKTAAAERDAAVAAFDREAFVETLVGQGMSQADAEKEADYKVKLIADGSQTA